MGYIFEGDPQKAKRNTRKHGVTFAGASTAFGDPLALLMPDPVDFCQACHAGRENTV